MKERLLNQALLTLRHGPALATLAGLPHGLIILAGPPGTGKTTLARGLAQMAARALAKRGATTYVEIDPHAFPSEMLGESQRNIARLMADTIPELAARRPHTVVLIDEVESFAVRRSAASFGANPVDVHRATDAVLAGIDAVAADLPRVLFVATTNFIEAVDEAFLSRADLVVDAVAARRRDHRADSPAQPARAVGAVAGPSDRWPTTTVCTPSWPTACTGWDGRRVRKLVLSALALRQATTRDPNLLTADDLLAAVEAMAPEDTGVIG